MLDALKYLAQMGVMHRDIKLENILFKNKESIDIIIIDFNLSEYVDNEEYMLKSCGTGMYVAPEIFNVKDYDEKVDIFSAGCLLYILLT